MKTAKKNRHCISAQNVVEKSTATPDEKWNKKQRKRYRFRCFHSIESHKFLHFFVALQLQNFSVDVQKISIRVQISVTNQPCQYRSVACHRSP